jgi:hypothetical protein
MTEQCKVLIKIPRYKVIEKKDKMILESKKDIKVDD